MTQPKLDPTLYILTLLRENNDVYNLYRLDGRQFKNETERFAIIDKLVHNGSISKVQGALGQTYQITDKGKSYFYQLCFEKVLQYLADNNDTFRHVSDILTGLAVSNPDDQLAEAIDLKLRRDDLVFATEDSGVMLNENGQNLLSEQKFGLTQQNQSTSIVNTGVLIQDSQVSHSSFSNFDQSQSISRPYQLQDNNSLPDKRGKRLKWISNHIVQIIIAIITTVVAGYILFRLGWN